MRSRTADWFEIKVRYDKIQEDGVTKPTTEQYVIDALSYTEAEAEITEEMSSYISGEFKITDMKHASFREVFFSDLNNDDCWFRTKLQFITFDEKTNKEKRSNVNYLVQAHALPQAVKYIEEVMGSTMIDYVIASISDTKIMDVYEHNAAIESNKAEESPEYVEETK